MATPSLRLTVFGLPGTGEEQAAQQTKLKMLYGNKNELSAKEKKKLLKTQKFLQKQKKKGEQPAGGADKGKGKKKDKKPPTKRPDRPASTYKYTAPAPGEKKDCSGEMAPVYNPEEVEDAWYEWWVKQGFFKPEYVEKHMKHEPPPGSEGKFTMVIPPPNVTGTLHLGHALTNAIEDCVTRWHRMRGEVALWNPGCDHAGIATQMVVEKRLQREQNLTRHDLGRDKFVEQVWEWKNEKGARIYEQIRGLGSSVDWEREAFTMSDRCCRAVQKAFIQFHEDGLIFRDSRLVNWSCHLKSAIADIEVDKKEISGKTEFTVPNYDRKITLGVISSFAYTVDETGDEIVVATTRPETMLGDVAVAVHPDDVRYQHLVGRTITHPFVDRKLVIVADTMADLNFGTGAVKITPAHDAKDFECGRRHNLDIITVIEEDGRMAANCGEFSGMKRFDARDAVLKRLEELGRFRGEAPNPMVIPVCSRSKDIVEPLIKPQWFCRCTEMAADAVRAVREGELRLIPSMFNRTWFHWLEDARDWCISRQLWWGHRIPAYFITINDGREPGADIDNQFWVSAVSETEAAAKAAKRFNVDASLISLRRDEDVLDTWFSAGIFPISIFGWPDQTEDLNKFYPSHLLETGHDILFFWVARMVMMCTRLTGQLPFKDVFLHSMVRDAHGRKMSKSLGNVIDPMDVRNGISLEDLQATLDKGNLDARERKRAKEGQKKDFPKGIPQCGTDALRFALCAFSQPGRDINLNVSRIEGYRKFCNKVFQATSFVLRQLGPAFKPAPAFALSGKETLADRWILHRLAEATKATNAAFKGYDFPGATSAVYEIILYDFCGIYMEFTKPIFRGEDEAQKETTRTVLYCLIDNLLRLLSPFMPYLTEELWQRLARRDGDAPSICVAEFPHSLPYGDDEAAHKFRRFTDAVKMTRSMKDEYLPRDKASSKPAVHLRVSDAEAMETLRGMTPQFTALAKCSSLEVELQEAPVPVGCAMGLLGELGVEVHVNLAEFIDPVEETKALQKRLEALKTEQANIRTEMEQAGYAKVPDSKRNRDLARIEACDTEMSAMGRALQTFAAMVAAMAGGSAPATTKGKGKGKGKKADKKQGKGGDQGKAAAAAAATGEFTEKQKKKAIKEGGKKGQDLAGLSDLGGVKHFTLAMHDCEGDMGLLRLAMGGMNKEVVEGADDRKGGAGHLAKMLLCANEKRLCCVAHVPEALKDTISITAWMTVIAERLKSVWVGDVVDGLLEVVFKGDPAQGHFPLKMRDEAINASFEYLKSKMLVMDEESSDDDVNLAEVAGIEW